MDFAAVTHMQALIQLLLEHPERFEATDIPCCLRGLLPIDEQPLDVHIPDTSRFLRPSHQHVGSREFGRDHRKHKS
jgi:hypothetical protein